jgi:trehalose-6-phosphatase
MSSLQPEELDGLFKRVCNLGLIAENGCFIKHFGSSKWTNEACAEKMREWKESVEGIMNYYQERTPDSWIEKRHCSLIFHYHGAKDSETASRQAGDCASHINDACREQRVRAIPIEGEHFPFSTQP